MSNYSKEKVLQWVNSSEARAAKYEQEAKVWISSNNDKTSFKIKDLMKKIQSLEEKRESCRQDLEEKIQLEEEVEAQEEVMQIAIVKRRERMMVLQDRVDQKLGLYFPSKILIHQTYLSQKELKKWKSNNLFSMEVS